MKKSTVICALRLLLGLVLMIGVKTFFQPCIHDDGEYGSCHWAGAAVFGIAVLIVLLSVISMIIKNRQMQKGISLSLAASAVLCGCIPGLLIRLCMMDTMRCLSVMKPAVIILSVLIAITSAVDLAVRE